MSDHSSGVGKALVALLCLLLLVVAGAGAGVAALLGLGCGEARADIAVVPHVRTITTCVITYDMATGEYRRSCERVREIQA